MEIILKTNNEHSIAKIIALAKKLNIPVEQRKKTKLDDDEIENLKQRILSFKANSPTSFPDAAEWEKTVRAERELPFSQ